MKKTVALALVMMLMIGNGCCEVVRDDWEPGVRQAINDFIALYGKDSENYSPSAYVVSDFDNTASIFDTCEMFMIYQAEKMAYGFAPEELPRILAGGLGDMDEDLTRYGYGKGSYRDWISDITAAYTHLWGAYGPFTPAGLDDETAEKARQDPMWAEFIAKIMDMYLLIDANESAIVSYPWITYLYAGMTEEELYSLSVACFEAYGGVDTARRTIATDGAIRSKVGCVTYTYIEGVQVTENIREMWRELSQAGIDVWVCSASHCEIIRAAIDAFGLHEYCAGLIGMTTTVTDGKLGCTYDYSEGYAWYPEENGAWRRGNVAIGALVQGEGKVTAIQNICGKEYGCGPLAGFMDSTGDYNFCTELASLKLVICFNRADRSVTDGGSVIAELALYQRDSLGYDLARANEAGDTLYVLQGRDENGLRTFRAGNATVRYGETEEKLLRDERNEKVLAYMTEKHMTTAEVINTFAIRTEEEKEGNPLGCRYGFLSAYDGYHSK